MKTPKARLYQRGKVWWFRFTLDGVRKAANTEETDRPKAEAKAARMILEAMRAKGSASFDAISSPATIVIERFIEVKEGDKLDPSTVANYRHYSKRFFAHFGNSINLASLTRFDVEGWKQYLSKLSVPTKKGKLSAKSIKSHLGFLSSVCKEMGISPNPTIGVKRPVKTILEKQEELKFHTAPQVRAFLDCAWKQIETAPDFRKNDARLFYWWSVVFFNTGCRLGEAQGIRFRDIDVERSTVYLRADKRDIGRVIALPVPAYSGSPSGIPVVSVSHHNSPIFALQIISLHARQHYGDSMTEDSVLHYQHKTWFYLKFKTCCEAAGIPSLSPHSARHSFITRALRTWSLAVLSKYVGHNQIATTMDIYGHLVSDETPKPLDW